MSKCLNELFAEDGSYKWSLIPSTIFVSALRRNLIKINWLLTLTTFHKTSRDLLQQFQFLLLGEPD